MKKIILGFVLIAVTGCLSTDPLYKPAKNVATTILPEYEKYVWADTTLSDFQKNIRIMNSESFRKLMKEYEAIK